MSYHVSIKPFWHPCPSDTSPDCEHRLLGKRGLSSETGHSPDDKSLDACQCYIFYILNISKTSHTSCISRLLNITSILPYSLKILLNSEGNIAENIYARVHFENRERESLNGIRISMFSVLNPLHWFPFTRQTLNNVKGGGIPFLFWRQNREN